MRLTVCLQISSKTLSPQELESLIGYKADRLTLKGSDRSPPRKVPAASLWNGNLVLESVVGTDEAVKTCLERYPEIASRLKVLRENDPDLACTFYISMRPFSKSFVLFFEPKTVELLSQLGCAISMEYFDD